ncbi:MAG: STAS domain-containing protein [Bacteroidia bacterium]|nr:STAS domain-containing protein [Bacteroidia bacterium]
MERTDMNFTHQLLDNIAVFKLEGSMLGENDGLNLTNIFTQYLEEKVTRFMFDLTDLKHINSSGLGVFITLLTKVRSRGGELVISNPAKNISNLLAITKLNTVFTITDTVEAGMKKLSER